MNIVLMWSMTILAIHHGSRPVLERALLSAAYPLPPVIGRCVRPIQQEPLMPTGALLPGGLSLSPQFPNAFNKISQPNAASGLPANPTIGWDASSNAYDYQYCVNTAATSCTTWSTAVGTSAALKRVTPGGKYYWQVRARNATGTTYANGGSLTSGWFSFTVIQYPGAFNKTSPANGAVGQPITPTLSWGASNKASSYEYCLDANSSCSNSSTWVSTGTSISVTLSGLAPGVTYYWHVRAKNMFGTTYANNDISWTITILPLPTDFAKISPTNNAFNRPSGLTLSWATSSGATSYAYCIDTVDDNACNTSWISTGTSNSVALRGLIPSTRYWQIRAINSAGTTYADGGSSIWWSFTIPTIPGTFNKLTPIYGAINQATNPTLIWETSSMVSYYQYCVNTSATNCTTWSNTVSTSVVLSGLNPGGKYFWHVRSRNSTGITYADGGSMTGWLVLIYSIALSRR